MALVNNHNEETTDVVEFPTRYKIIRGEDWLDLAQAVNKSLADGWILAGSMTHVPPDPMELVRNTNKILPFWQAMHRP